MLTTARAAVLLAAALVLGSAPRASAQDEDVDALRFETDLLSSVYQVFAPFPWTEKPDQASFVYADSKNTIRQYLYDGGRLRETWKSFPLEGAAQAVFAEDLNGDGRPEIITFTTGARIYVWETIKYTLLWESVEENFETISAMAIANVDRDAALELVVCADNLIHYYDGVEFFRDKVGRDFVDPRVILVADVDGDLTDEIITDDGYVLDTNTLSIEYAVEGFGYPMSLFDIDNDGILEVMGEKGGVIQFWDVKDRREIW
ncbi:MAG: hypothetical protein KC591_04045 [Gemmatimonadetes bacterium]|nr:hypothetical protein [Gemmatimonadota bacterium]